MNAADGVLRRWNPRGWMQLHEPPATGVRVVGVPGSGAGTLASELRHLGGVDIVDAGRAAAQGPSDRAAVTLVVFDPSAVIGRTELALVRAAAAESIEVVCALTGIDRYPDRRAVRDADVEILHRHAPWLPRVVVLPVSAEAARRAREHDASEALRQTALAGSGIVELRDVLAAAVRSSHDPRRVRTAVVAATRPMIGEEMERLRTEDDGADLRAERSRLTTAAPPATSGPDLRRLQVMLLHEVAVRVRAASTDAVEVLETADGDAVVATIDAHLDDLCAWLTDETTRIAPGTPGPEATRTSRPPGTARSLEDTLTVVFGASAGAGLGRLLVTPFGNLPGWMSLVVAIACAVPAAGWLMRVRRRIAYRERMRRWIADELATVRAELDSRIRTRIHETELQSTALAIAARDRHATRVRERIAAIDEEITRRRGERRARIAACERDLAALGHDPEPRDAGVRRTG
ncbi:hypothetical protein [Rhodococcus gordoniae]|uniref:hypothetical protein n=1 Tax=Rhodococcus gordoniae TaxID=223392 RepID=UPI0020CC2075|nr:hypothetical protein [Rhodococcus gordoniae]UTT48180.1 hypothetical protein NMQ04_18405 [Rhodococcus gordoniae]